MDRNVKAYLAEIGRREARVQLRQGVAAGIYKVPDLDAAFDLVFGTISETIRRVSKAPDQPKRCDEVVTMVLICLGVEARRIEQVMALPMPSITVTPRVAAARKAPQLSTG